MAAIGALLGPELQELIRERRWEVVRDALARLDPADVADILVEVPAEADAAIFRLLPRTTRRGSSGRSPTTRCGTSSRP